MKPVFIVSVSILSLLCAGCATQRVATGPRKLRPPLHGTAPPKGKDDSGQLFGLTDSESGTAADKHSDVASKTPDGGKSASEGAPSQTAAKSEAEGAEAAAKAAKDKAAADLAAKAAAAAANDDTFGESHGFQIPPVDGSDPSVGRPIKPGRKVT